MDMSLADMITQNEEEKEEEKDDLKLLDETRADQSPETNEEEEKEKRKNEQLDAQIGSQSEESQIAFLQGAIPKVVFEHAIKGTDFARSFIVAFVQSKIKVFITKLSMITYST